MKSLINLLILVTLTLVLHSCIISRPIEVSKAPNNQTYEIEYLFEKDGYKMYRFRDYGHYVYFTTKNGSTMSVTDDSLKTVTRVVNPD